MRARTARRVCNAARKSELRRVQKGAAQQRTVAFESARDHFGDTVLAEVNHVLEREAQEKRYRRFLRGAAAVAAGRP